MSIYDLAKNPCAILKPADHPPGRGPKDPPLPHGILLLPSGHVSGAGGPWPIANGNSPVPAERVLSDHEAHRLTAHNKEFIRSMLTTDVQHG